MFQYLIHEKTIVHPTLLMIQAQTKKNIDKLKWKIFKRKKNVEKDQNIDKKLCFNML
jgi:hypothetical protein